MHTVVFRFVLASYCGDHKTRALQGLYSMMRSGESGIWPTLNTFVLRSSRSAASKVSHEIDEIGFGGLMSRESHAC